MARKLNEESPEEIGFFKGRDIVVDLSLRVLPNGFGYVRADLLDATGASLNFPPRGGRREDEDEIAPEKRAQWRRDDPWRHFLTAKRCGLLDWGPEAMARMPDYQAAESDMRDPGCMVRRIPLTGLAHGMERLCVAMEAISKAKGLSSWRAVDAGRAVDPRDWAAAHARLDQLASLGCFECPTGILWASDPCYEQDPGLGARLDGARGSWDAYSTRMGKGMRGDRCARLLIVPKGEDPLPWLAECGPAELRVVGESSVDSGQAGFFDSKAFVGSGGRDDAFYGACGAQTLENMGAGVVELGAVSASGDGDGGYPILAARGPDGALMAARIDFYEMEPEELDAWRGRLAAADAAKMRAELPEWAPTAGSLQL